MFHSLVNAPWYFLQWEVEALSEPKELKVYPLFLLSMPCVVPILMLFVGGNSKRSGKVNFDFCYMFHLCMNVLLSIHTVGSKFYNVM